MGDELLPDITGKRWGALPLYTDLGGAILLRADERSLKLEWDAPSELSPSERDEPSWKVAIVAGVERYPWLVTLRPIRSVNAITCEACGGSNKFPHLGSRTVNLYRRRCDGFGWYERAI